MTKQETLNAKLLQAILSTFKDTKTRNIIQVSIEVCKRFGVPYNRAQGNVERALSLGYLDFTVCKACNVDKMQRSIGLVQGKEPSTPGLSVLMDKLGLFPVMSNCQDCPHAVITQGETDHYREMRLQELLQEYRNLVESGAYK